MNARSPVASRTSGYTLLEILVVLILMGLAAALVAPAVLTRRAAPQPSFAALVQDARAAAARRGELVYLGISSTGNWRLDGAASTELGPFATGRLSDYSGPAATIVISPIGSCGFDIRSSAAARAIPLDPLTCEVQTP